MKRWNCPASKLRTLVRRLWTVILFMSLACSLWADSVPQLLSVRNATIPLPVVGSGYSALPYVSADGRFVVFTSSANDLVAGDNGFFGTDVFLRDRSSNTTVLVSANLDGTGGGNENSASGMVSTNGRYVVFQSEADDLTLNDTNDVDDIFVRDLATGTTRLVSVSTNGGSASAASSDPVITPDGRYVVFISAATNLVANDANGIPDVFVRDLVTETTTLVSAGATQNATAAGTFMSTPSITPDGHYAAFASNARNLAVGVPTLTMGEVYVRDLIANSNTWVSRNAAMFATNVLGPPNFFASSHPVLSDDGRFVAFKTGFTNGVRASVILRFDSTTGVTTTVYTNAFSAWTYNDDVYGPEMTPDGRFIAFVARESGSNTNSCSVRLWDAQTGTNVLISAEGTGAVPTNSISRTPALSVDGRYVVFASNGTNLVGNVVSNGFHLYLRDVQAGTNQLLDVDLSGVGSTDLQGAIPSISSDGQLIAFCGPDGKLVAGDNNGAFDVFLRNVTAGSAELISQRAPGLITQSGNGISSMSQFSISADGRWIAFSSYAEDLVLNDTNGTQDVFLLDRLTGTNILVSVGTNGWSGTGIFSGSPAISADGRFVAYASSASNLVTSPVNHSSGIFLYDRVTGSNQMISVTALGAAPNGDCVAPTISADGNYVTYLSQASNVGQGAIRRNVSAGTNLFLTGTTTLAPAMTSDGRLIAYLSSTGVRVWDALGGTNLYSAPSGVVSMSLSPAGNALAYQVSSGALTIVDLRGKTNVANFSSQSPLRSIVQWSSDGRFFAWSTITILLPSDFNGIDVYLYDLPNNAITLVSFNSVPGGSGSARSDWPAMSGDGRFVIYRSFATNIVAGTGTAPNIYLFDRLSGSNSLVSVSGSNPEWSTWVSKPAISSHGDLVLFEGWGSGTAANDINRVRDVFTGVVDAAVDSDADGIPDSWMTQYFGHPTGQQSDLSRAQDDVDGDGLSNLEEYIAGTNPLDPASALRLRAEVANQTYVWLKWFVTPGRTYRVEFKNDLTDPAWSSLPGNYSVTGNQASFLVSKPTPARYYRVVGSY
jgi:Bacterial TSP3 repeat/WD40-like Beta Propeller Repeat